MKEFDRLNHTERRVLRLLAQGHTAKSVAVIESCSVSSVNERLREARRKTGLGSSRELARRLVAQENRDANFGVAPLKASSGMGTSPSQSRGLQVGVVLMISLTVVAAVWLTLGAGGGGSPASIATQFAQPNDTSEPQHVRLAKALSREQRDQPWANRLEPALEKRFATIDGLVDRKVRCAATMCEVSGRLSGTSATAINESMQNLQSSILDTDMRKLGLRHQLTTFGSTKKAGHPIYTAFWTRESGG